MGEEKFEGMTALQKAKAEAESAALADLENFEIRETGSGIEATVMVTEDDADAAPAAASASAVPVDGKAAGEKMYPDESYVQAEPYRPYGGSVTWAEYEEHISGLKEMEHAEITTYTFQTLMRNILQSSEIENKGEAIATLARGFQDRLEQGPEDKALSLPPSPSLEDPDEKRGILDGIKALLGIQKTAENKELAPGSDLSGFIVQKDLKGNSRWFGWVSNQFRDRDAAAFPEKGGEILSEEAHRWFVDWVWQKPKSRMPELWLWHTPGTKTAVGFDWIDYADGFLVGSGPLTDEEAGQFEGLAKSYDLAMSHGLVKVPGYYDERNGIANRYLSFEGSALPRKAAANLWTDYLMIEQEVKEMFSPEKRTYLVSALGEERVKELEAATKERATALKQAGVEFKDNGDGDGADEPTAPVEVEAPEAPASEPAPTAEAVKAAPDLIVALAKEFALPELSAHLEAMNKEVADLKAQNTQMATIISSLQKSDDAKVAAALTPKIEAKSLEFIWQNAASKSEGNLVEDNEADKALAANAPKGGDGHWLKEVLGGEREAAPVTR